MAIVLYSKNVSEGSFRPIKITMQSDDGRSIDGWMSVEDAGEMMRALKNALTQLLAEAVRLSTQPQAVLTDGNSHSLGCRFLEVDEVSNEEGAAEWAVKAALQHNKVYCDWEDHTAFRETWKTELRRESERYQRAVSDAEHCQIIAGIADRLSARFYGSLQAGRLRFGTSQKAFNLYLKYLWHFGTIPAPPHCPFDRIILHDALNIYENWTQSDDVKAYMRWVHAARSKARTASIAEWECSAWIELVPST